MYIYICVYGQWLSLSDLRHPRVFGTDHEAERLLVLRQVPFHRTLLLNHKRLSDFGFRVSGFEFRV